MLNNQNNILMKEQNLRSTSWAHHFIFLNSLLAIFIGSAYVYAAPSTESFISYVYLLATWLGQISFLGFLSFLIVFFPLTFIGNFKAYRVSAIILAFLIHCLLLVDAKLFLSVKVHLTWSVTSLMLRDLDFKTGLNFNFMYIAMPIIAVCQYFFAKLATREIYKKSVRNNYFPAFVMTVVSVCFISSHCIYIWADANNYEKVTNLRSVFPAHYPMTARSFLSNHGWIEDATETDVDGVSTSNVEYPLQEIESTVSDNSKNIVTIFINGLSYADLDVNDTPNLMALKMANMSLENHFLPYFSLEDNLFASIYGLPIQYKYTFEKHSIETVVVNEMQHQEYLLRAFTKSITKDEVNVLSTMSGIHKTKIKSLKTDLGVFDSALNFIKDNKAHHFAININTSSLVALIANKQQYKLSLKQIDKLLGGFLSELENEAVLDKTLVIITSALGNGQYATSSVYPKKMQRVPFIIMWPENSLKGISVNSLTSHFDLSSTLGVEILGIKTPCVNYGLGNSVLKVIDRDHIVTTKGNSLLLISKDAVIVYKKNGKVQRDDDGVVKTVRPNLENLIRAMRDLNRFKG